MHHILRPVLWIFKTQGNFKAKFWLNQENLNGNTAAREHIFRLCSMIEKSQTFALQMANFMLNDVNKSCFANFAVLGCKKRTNVVRDVLQKFWKAAVTSP